jgi:hypothetical protein
LSWFACSCNAHQPVRHNISHVECLCYTTMGMCCQSFVCVFL